MEKEPDMQTSNTSGVLRGVAKTRDELIPLLKKYASEGNYLSCFFTTETMGFNVLL